MSEFQREDRYIVIKRSDLNKVPVAYRSHLVDPMLSLLCHLPHRECAVIESDWPEFEPVWRMIEARVTGVMPEVMRWPLKGVLPGVEGMSKAVLRPVVVLASDYDALAAQRDEGLAREAELRSEVAELEDAFRLKTKFFDQECETTRKLKQRLAEAEKISWNLAFYLSSAIEANACHMSEESLHDALSWLHKQRLATPGCADGEKKV